jgi:hypothetical protein
MSNQKESLEKPDIAHVEDAYESDNPTRDAHLSQDWTPEEERAIV